MSSSPRITALVFLELLFCLLLNVSCPFAQSIRAIEEDPRLVERTILMKISGRLSLRLHKGLLPRTTAVDFSGNGSEGGAAGARKMTSLSRDDGEVEKGRGGMREEGSGASHGKHNSIWEGIDEGRAGFVRNTMKVGLGVRHGLRPRSKRKGKGGGDRGYAGGFVAFNADYHFPRQHPPRNN